MVSVCLPSDALLQHPPSYLGFSYLGRGVSLHSCSSKAQPLLLILDKGYLLTATLPELQRGIAPLGPSVPVQPQLLGHGVGLPSHRPWPWVWVAPPGRHPWPPEWRRGVAPPARRPWPRAWGIGCLLPAAAPDLGRGVTPLLAAPDLGHWVSPFGRPLTLDVG